MNETTGTAPLNFPYAGANLGGQMLHRCGDPGEYGCGALVLNDAIEDHRAWHKYHDRMAKEEAWDEGFEAGHQFARAVNPEWPKVPQNPHGQAE